MKNVEDMYPLSPMQEMMLLHTLSKAETDVLFSQFCYQISGELNVAAFRQAWQQIVDRHPVLRTAFVWDTLKQPLQIVRRHLKVPFEQLDWRGLSTQAQRAELEAFCLKDRQRGFNPSKAPLNRLVLIQLSQDSFYFIWSNHHLILDRWCLSTIFKEFFVFYESSRQGRPLTLEKACPYRNYITWIQQQNLFDAESFWRKTLDGFTVPTPITVAAQVSGALPQADQPVAAQAELSPITTQTLRTFTRQHGLTVSIVIQGAWALLLNNYTERQDVVFGVAVSGRPADLAGVESILGSFVNNLPVRVRLSRDAALIQWLRDIQAAQQRRSAFEYVSLATIHEWCELPSTQHLFDNLLVWLAPEAAEKPGSLTLQGLQGDLKTAYPFTLSIAEVDERIAVYAHCSPSPSTVAPVSQIVQQLLSMVETILAADSHCRLAELEGFRGNLDYRATTESENYKDGVVPADGNFDAGKTEAISSTGGRETFEIEVLQDLLLAEWQQVLGINEIGLDDDFFKLGGDSLQAIGLHARVEASTRKAVPLLALFRAPNIRQMARTLWEQNWPLKPNIVMPIRAQGSKPPLFCVASPEVNTVGYSLLARYLDGQQPVYVLQSPPDLQEVQRLSPSKIPGLASKYIEAMQTVHSVGPYRLLGTCTGAHLAFEMARQLESSGQTVAFFGILNTWAFYTVSKLYYVNRLLNRIRYYAQRLRTLLQLEPHEQLATLQRVAGRRMTSVKQTITHFFGGDSSSTVSVRPGDPWIEDVGWVKDDLPQSKFPGVVTVFRIRRQRWWRVRDPSLGWENQAEAVRIVQLPGKEYGLLGEPQVRVVAEKVQDYLE